ncbi:hypothetical protein IC611_14950 [Proteus mirabilis]
MVTKVRNDLIGEQQSGQQNIPNNIPDNSSVGAMEVPNTTLEQETLKGPSFINRTMNVSPVGSVAQSPLKQRVKLTNNSQKITLPLLKMKKVLRHLPLLKQK